MTNALHDTRNDVAREMARYLEQWAPFGGGDDEIFTTFGVSPSVFYSRLVHSLRVDPSLVVAHDVDKLIAYCVRKAGIAADAHAR
ncbi:hypothetical protein [Gordonia lacunae]|uniref:DUF3263 domain-containing protein n=1 Tax=Gordonia lacunae TaxID=417102 RepID=A0A243QEY6_9ACTN|nr:hypothetical protein [Gordonia lacunae]OUC80293.1 hypothetical protein CA982_03610 [Gordonia lacunae]